MLPAAARECVGGDRGPRRRSAAARRRAHEPSVLVIGAGYLGLSAALHLAEAGADVIVARCRGAGLGRVGPQWRPGDPGPQIRSRRDRSDVRPRARRAPLALRRRRRPISSSTSSRGTGSTAARGARRGSRASIRAKAATRARRAWTTGEARGADVAYLDRERGRRRSPAPISIVGAFVDQRAAALQPLSYVRELARAALAAGARVHGGARVVTLDAERLRLACGRPRPGATVVPTPCSSRPTPMRIGIVPGSRALDRRVELAADRDGAASRRAARERCCPTARCCPTRAGLSATGGSTMRAGC